MLKFRVLLIASFFSFCSHAQEQEDIEFLFWGEQQLEWGHFRGEAKLVFVENSPADAMSQIAVILQKDSYQNGKWCFRARTIFVTRQSWCRYKEEELLQHEQLHFDIYELIARKLRRFAQEVEGEMTRAKFDQQFAQLKLELDSINEKYDQQTGHGSKHTLQSAWDEKITKALDSLSEYNESVLICIVE